MKAFAKTIILMDLFEVMWMKKKSSKFLLIACGMLLMFLAVFVYLEYPVYLQAEQGVESISALCDKLSDNTATRKLVVVDPGRFGGEMQTQTVRLDGRGRCAKPLGYCITWAQTENEEFVANWSVIGELPEAEDDFDGISYRDSITKLEIIRDLPHNRVIALSLRCGEYSYTIDVTFDTTGLSEKEIAERETALQKFVYAVADQIIDAAG